jgi:undecaprenyl-diphosphatase
MDTILAWDRSLLLWLQQFNNTLWDFIMYWSTHKFTWIPLYVFLVYLIYRSQGKKVIYYLIAIAVMIFICDKTASAIFKPLFHRLRPCNDPVIGSDVHIVYGYCSQSYSFFSSHAANSFGFAVILTPIFTDKRIIILLYGWAFFHSYTRIYLGQHFPTDILAGMIFGSGVGYLVYCLTAWALRMRHK